MSSHLEWMNDVVARHDAEKPFAPENGVALQFKPGDRVRYTNQNGATFRGSIVRLHERSSRMDIDYVLGARYWMTGFNPLPVRECDLCLDTDAEANHAP